MGIDNPEIADSVKKIEELEKKLFAHPQRKVRPLLEFSCLLVRVQLSPMEQ